MAGSKGSYARWVGNDLVYYTAGGTEIFRVAGGSIGILHQPAIERTLRTRVTAAQVHAGFTLLPALPGYKYRITDVTMVAVGGNATSSTSVNLIGTQAASAVQLIVAAVAALTRSAHNKPNTASITVLADGASFATNDANTAITIADVGGALTVATAIDIVLTYAIET